MRVLGIIKVWTEKTQHTRIFSVHTFIIFTEYTTRISTRTWPSAWAGPCDQKA